MTTKRDQTWSDTYARLAAADIARTLSIDELERLALASYLLGKDTECANAWTRAHHECIRQSEPRRAARIAFWNANALIIKGQMAPAMGWIARGGRVLEDQGECAEQAWLLVLTGLPIMFEGDVKSALGNFVEADTMATRAGDRDAIGFARMARGHALVQLGEMAQGMHLLDEVMVDVISGQLSPLLCGTVYCQTIATCHEVFDVRRAREWTAALSAWCEANADMVPYRGNCLVHRAEIFQLQGAWPAAHEAAEQAILWLAGPPVWDSLGSAFYRLAEVQRLRGEFTKAEASYRRAGQRGWNPEPGWSLLRMSRGRTDLAVAGVRRALTETQGRVQRCRLLPAYIEIMLANGDMDAAGAAAIEVAETAELFGSPYLLALAEQAKGAVLIEEGDPAAAIEPLRSAWKRWQEIEAPYEASRVRALIGLAYRALGDPEGAAVDLEAARLEFQRLGAVNDLANLEKLTATAHMPGGLTAREVEVLALLAAGKTNREIAEALVISEHTVARHVQNIFTKLGVTSRAAATAFAYEHKLL